jgi:hypothetical protein
MNSATRAAVDEVSRPGRGTVWIYSLTILLAAFLLFQVELILSAHVLPWFGGSAAVWTTTMLVFQTLLFAAYAYAHQLASRLLSGTQVRLHLALIAVSVAALAIATTRWPSPITPGVNWKPSDTNHPALDIIAILLVSVGIPFFLLSTSGPLLQAWYARATERAPYRLYAVSNFGSLLGLLSYPFLVQPLFKLRTQGWLLSALYLVFAAGVVGCAAELRSARRADPSSVATAPESPGPSGTQYALWILLPGCASVALLATTSVISLYLAATPLIWVLPLSVYLISFIICFGRPAWYVPGVFHALYGVGCVVLLVAIASADVWFELASCLFLLFAICMICHGEAVRIQPAPERATAFYLSISGGGALGGIFVGAIAPLMFSRIWEFQFVIVATGLLVVVGLYRQQDSWLYRSPRLAAGGTAVLLGLLPYLGTRLSPEVARSFEQMGYFQAGALLSIPLAPIFGVSLIKPKRSHSTLATLGLLALALVLLAYSLYRVPWGRNGTTVARIRNFYGVLEVQQLPEETLLMHGKTLHGSQLRSPTLQQMPTTYYAPESGFGQFMLSHPKRNPVSAMRIGVIGMGTGTIAAYGLPGDYVRFYELNPGVDEMVRGKNAWFSYVNDSRARVDVVLGDGRLSLERELKQGTPQNFDVLVLDAFNGDAIPVHLLTVEAFQTYLQHMARDGVLAVHVSSSTLDLSPVLLAAMRQTGLHGTLTYSADEATKISSIWVLFARNPELLRAPGLRRVGQPLDHGQQPVYWNDDHTDITRLLYR